MASVLSPFPIEPAAAFRASSNLGFFHASTLAASLSLSLSLFLALPLSPSLSLLSLALFPILSCCMPVASPVAACPGSGLTRDGPKPAPGKPRRHRRRCYSPANEPLESGMHSGSTLAAGGEHAALGAHALVRRQAAKGSRSCRLCFPADRRRPRETSRVGDWHPCSRPPWLSDGDGAEKTSSEVGTGDRVERLRNKGLPT